LDNGLLEVNTVRKHDEKNKGGRVVLTPRTVWKRGHIEGAMGVMDG
jgi:hypothetical protein